MKIFVASGNPHKIAEISSILEAGHPGIFDLESISAANIPEPAEPYSTFMENAKHKAQYYADWLDAPTLSEDSGLCIPVLDNFPGVTTKDFVQECGSLEAAFATLESRLKHKDKLDAFFVCAAALYLPEQKQFLTYEAKCNGVICFPARGNRGFGFDPIFIPQGYQQSMAELGDEIKNIIGHRALAIRGLIDQVFLQKIIL